MAEQSRNITAFHRDMKYLLLKKKTKQLIRHILKGKGINYDWKNIVRIMNTHNIQTIVLPTDKKIIHRKKPVKSIDEVRQIYDAANSNGSQKAVKKYVVYH